MDCDYELIIPHSYAKKAQDAIHTRKRLLQYLVNHRKIPEEGYSDKVIESIFLELTFSRRCFGFSTELIAKRHYGLLDGTNLFVLNKMKQNKDFVSVISQLANSYAAELIKIMGIKESFNCCVIPVATGMSLIFSMLTFRFFKPKANYVLWSRIDQKSCFKSIISAGLVPVVIDTVLYCQEYVTDVKLIEHKIQEIGVDNINCIVTTTSCFAPRACDSIEVIAELCDKYNLFHLVNNAYGLSNPYLMKRIHKSSLKGRIDIFVQSTDKNLCVPVGGAIVASFNTQIFLKFTEICSEKMCDNAATDLVITLLSMGKKKYLAMIDSCEVIYKYLKNEIVKLANKYEEKVIENPGNPISIALTLNNIPKQLLTQVGSMLYTRNVSGARVVTTEETKTICDITFQGWGAHSSSCRMPYLTAAASIGILRSDVDIFVEKLDKVFETLLKEER